MGEIMDAKFRTEIAQNDEEFSWLCALLERERVTSYLEIGARYGGSFWRMSSILPRGALMVAVDLPQSAGGRSDSRESLTECIAALRARSFKARAILGDSNDMKVVEEVRRHAPYDAILIDANHTLPYCMRDWFNYSPMGKIIAFHDIAWERPDDWNGGSKERIDVPILWEALKPHHRHAECKREKRNNGIGVLWRLS